MRGATTSTSGACVGQDVVDLTSERAGAEQRKEGEGEKEGGNGKVSVPWSLPPTNRNRKPRRRCQCIVVMGFFSDFMVDHRSWFVVFFVIPISLVFDVLISVRTWLILKLNTAPAQHSTRIALIQEAVRAHAARNDGTKLCTARGGWQSMSPGYRDYKNASTQIAINLYDVLSWSAEDMTITVEPMVNMGMVSAFLIPKGFTLPVLPEMDDLTVGGLYMGVGIETSSHKYGLFNDSVVSAEVILSDGTLVVCSRTSHPDLFDALPWSYGTLGFLASVTMRIIPCKPYVRVDYIPFKDKAASVASFADYSSRCDTVDFVEALAYSKTEMVVMPAYFASAEEAKQSGKINTISLWFKPWFYKHVETILKTGQPTTEYIPLRDYYHRHTKSIFWELEQILPVGNSFLFRYLLGWSVPPKVSFLKLTQTAAVQKLYEEQHVIQDMLVPVSEMSGALSCFHEHYDIYPLWLCPYRAYDYSTFSDGGKKTNEHRCFLRKPAQASRPTASGGKPSKDPAYEMYVDLGAYGVPRAVLEKRNFNAVAKGRIVEEFVMTTRGFQMLYADSYLSRDDFRKMFDHKHYDEMKKLYDPKGVFPEVFEKVCKKAAAIWKARKAENTVRSSAGVEKKKGV